MSSLHLVLCRGAIALGLVVAGVCGGHACVALSANDPPQRRSHEMLAAAGADHAPARLAQAQAPEGFPQRTNARVRGRKSERLLVLR
jgi:hypothetical protein